MKTQFFTSKLEPLKLLHHDVKSLQILVCFGWNNWAFANVCIVLYTVVRQALGSFSNCLTSALDIESTNHQRNRELLQLCYFSSTNWRTRQVVSLICDSFDLFGAVNFEKLNLLGNLTWKKLDSWPDDGIFLRYIRFFKIF